MSPSPLAPLPTNNPSLALPLQRGGNEISSLPPLQGGIKGVNILDALTPLSPPLEGGKSKFSPLKGGVRGGSRNLVCQVYQRRIKGGF